MATVIRIAEYGRKLGKLEQDDTSKPLPPPARGHVNIKIDAAACTPADLTAFTGASVFYPPIPFVGGSEGVGKVTAVGEGVTSLKLGDIVIPAVCGLGMWRSEASLVESALAPVPDGVDPEVAAHVSASSATAHRILNDFVPLEIGDHVVFTGASSAVEQILLQMGANMGLETVCIVRNDAEREFAQELGVGKAVDLKEFKALKMHNTALVADGEGGKVGATVARSLMTRGCFLSYGDTSQQGVSLPVGGLIFKDIYCRGFSLARWASERPPVEMRDLVRDMLGGADRLRLLGVKRFPLAEANRAVETVTERPEGTGPVILTSGQ